MSRFYPHPAYAEDQPFSRAILTIHVLTRGFQAGAVIGSFVALPVHYFTKPDPVLLLSLRGAVIRSTGVGTVVGTGMVGVVLAVRMWDKEPIEWADRSWRLLENKGQVEMDDWGYGGAVMGAAATYFSNNMASLGWRGVLGGTGLGSVGGICAYMVWRNATNGGKWPEDKSLLA